MRAEAVRRHYRDTVPQVENQLTRLVDLQISPNCRSPLHSKRRIMSTRLY
jgi:hypothetical protein